MRKIALPTPAAVRAVSMAGPQPAMAQSDRARAARAQAEAGAIEAAAAASAPVGRPTAAGRSAPTPGSRPGTRLRDVVTGLIRRPASTRPALPPVTSRRSIDWDANPAALQAGNLSGLDAEVAETIRLAAARPEVVAFASQFGIDPVKLVLALLARSQATASRSARRLARALLAGVPEGQLETLARRLGFSTP